MLTLCLCFTQTAPEKTDLDAEGLTQHAFPKPSITPIIFHSLCHYVRDLPGHQVIINDKNCHGVMVVSHEFKIAIVSLPQFKMEQASDKKCLPGLLGSTCSMTSPVSLTGDFSRDTLTTTIVVIDTPTLHKIPDMSERTETNPIIIPEDHVLSKMMVIIPIFGDIDVAQGSISDDDAEQCISGCCPLAKIWFFTVKCQSTSVGNIQL